MDNRYSRQTYTFGLDTQKKLNESKILIIGYSVLSMEFIKNVVLMGIKYIDLYHFSYDLII